jgi:uncharacterized protein YbjQ (UPF0145 family)
VTYLASVKETFVDKRWGIIAITLGILVGVFSAFICIKFNLVIFGFNIMYILSPLAAGFVETVIAREKYGKSTGAISALLTFILINIWGWFLLGYITNNPTTFNLITLIAIVLTIQAAFPIFMNYLLFVVGVSILKKIIGFLVYLPTKIQGKPKEVVEDREVYGPSVDEVFLDSLKIPLVSVPNTPVGTIKTNIGLVTGEAIAEEKEAKNLITKLTNIIEPTQIEDIYLGEAKKVALSRMLQTAKDLGANTVIEVLIDYVSIGGFQGNAFIVTATGTAVLYE